jgi:hypothetical protein
VDPNYISAYAKARLLHSNTTDHNVDVQLRVRDVLRHLQAKPIDRSIQCINQYDAVSFSISNEHFPVFVKDSIYNSDPNYDFGVFTKLKNKLLLSQLNLKTFMVTFKDLGVFAIGDYATPDEV